MSNEKSISRREFLEKAGKAGLVVLGMATPGFLAACSAVTNQTGKSGAAGGSQEKVKLTFARQGNGQDKSAWDALLKQFMDQNPDIEVQLIYVPGSDWDDYFNKVSVMIAGGTPPDVAHIAIEGTQLFVKKNMAIELTPYMKNDPVDKLDDIHPNIQKAFIIDGKYFGLPFTWNNRVMYFNTKMLGEAKLELPPPTWNLDDFFRYCKELTRDSNGKKQFGYQFKVRMIDNEQWLYSNGAAIFNDDMTKCTLNDPACVESFQFFHDLIYKYKYAPTPSEVGAMGDPFLTQNVAMAAAGYSPVTGYLDQKFTDFNIQSMPTLKKPSTIYGVDGFMIMKDSKHPNETWKFIKFLNSAAAQTQLFSSGIPSRKSVAEEQIPKKPPQNGKLYYESAEVARPVQAPPTFNKLNDVYTRVLGSVFANEVELKKGLDYATSEMQKILDKGL
ncbi:ABC transporter substrate-binding protein [Paenibacillus piri]|uniref:ABC transporter substrate-binding protein n=1 Tax=Paenibacillus piri TaxID=2547395 RepID=UPI00140439AB|nr:sugar ABC transporter substrate-binding protein [Paenibacillus piri]